MKLNSLIGMSLLKARIRTSIKACENSKKVFPHTLMYSIGGCGKTALARAIGDELNYHFVEVLAAIYKSHEQLLQALHDHSQAAQRAGKPLLFFIDEIHRLSLPLQESLYMAMKENKLVLRSGTIIIPSFTLIGATTRFDMLDANSFVTRFRNIWEIKRYDLKSMMEIVAYELSKAEFDFKKDVIHNIAQRCLGIPRNAVNLVEKVTDTVMSHGSRVVTMNDVIRTFELEEIDYLGLHPVHRRYLQILKNTMVNDHYAPLGVGAISSKMRQHEDAVKGSVEPILLELDFVAATPRGRMLTQIGSDFLKKVLDISP